MQWYCQTCNQYFETKNKLRIHKHNHPHKCKYCGNEFETEHKMGNHQRFCQLNPNVQQNKKKQISSLRNYYLNLPQDSRWRNKERYISKPCQYLKQYLRNEGINFYPEYFNPEQFEGHIYSLDIAFPNQKIAIEVNGTQHYKRNGELTDYHQQRHSIVQKAGWKVYQIPYKNTFLIQFRQALVQLIKNNIDFTYDYSKEIKENNQKRKVKQKYICPICGREKKTKQSKYCVKCSNKLRIKEFKIPVTKQQLILDKENLKSYQAIGRKYNLTGAAIKRWFRKYQLI